ncbi:MAG: cyclic pyranopterin monophosphate synthase MoaC [Thermoanaerobaculia bacterium]
MPRKPSEESESASLTHVDAQGRARMVDISQKPVTLRIAEASCRLLCAPSTALRLGSLPKGDAVAVARIAGIQAAKRTDEWIPLAHTLPLDDVEITIEPGESEVRIASRVAVTARTGAEMEAMVACAAAALAIYDMVKAIDRTASVTDLRLEAKSGGRSGDFRRAP